jgi:hypothetical protein
MTQPPGVETTEDGEAKANIKIQEEADKDEICQVQQPDPDEKMKQYPDQSTILYSPIHPGKITNPDKESIGDADEEDDGVSIRDLILGSLKFLCDCIYFLRYSTKPSMFGMLSFLVNLIKQSLQLPFGSYLLVLLFLDFWDISLSSSICLSIIF